LLPYCPSYSLEKIKAIQNWVKYRVGPTVIVADEKNKSQKVDGKF
jgi:hypothetical protein